MCIAFMLFFITKRFNIDSPFGVSWYIPLTATLIKYASTKSLHMTFAPQRVMTYVVRVVTVRLLETFPGEGSFDEWEKEREARLRAASSLLPEGGS